MKYLATILVVLFPFAAQAMEDRGPWSQTAPMELNWNEAKDYCENLTEKGHSNWRLPSVDEIRTLIRNCEGTETGGACGVTDECLSHGDCWNLPCAGCPYAGDGRYSIFGEYR